MSATPNYVVLVFPLNCLCCMCECDFVWLYLTDQRTSISWIGLLVMFAESLGKSIRKRQSTCAQQLRETCSCTLDISNLWNSDLFSLSEAGHYHVKWKVGSMYRLTEHLLIYRLAQLKWFSKPHNAFLKTSLALVSASLCQKGGYLGESGWPRGGENPAQGVYLNVSAKESGEIWKPLCLTCFKCEEDVGSK